MLPDINESQMKFTVGKGKTDLALPQENVSEGAVRSIIEGRRADGNYRSFRIFATELI